MIINETYRKVWWQAIAEGYSAKELLYSVSPDQIECKEWLIDELPLELYAKPQLKIQLLGGWYGYPLIDILMDNFNNIKKITNIDLDKSATALCRRYTNIKRLKDIVDDKTQDASLPIPSDDSTGLIINTSSEHMPDLPILIQDRNISKECVFALQSNNMEYVEDHTNCVSSADHLVEKSGLTHILYSGTHKMNNGYERYMVIGTHSS